MIATRVHRAYLVAVFIALLGVGRISIVPISVLLGKLPDPPAELMLRAVLHAFPIFLVGCMPAFAAGFASMKNKHLSAIMLLIAAPLVSFLTLVLVGV